MKTIWKPIAVIAAVTGMLGGCAVYEPVPQGYAQAPAYRTYPPVRQVYEQPAPVYVQPAPVYVEPPVTFGFNFGYWGGHRWHH